MLLQPIKLSFTLGAALVAIETLFSSPSAAALIISNPNATYTIDFDNTVAGVNNGAYTGSGFSPTPVSGQLNSSAWATTGMSEEAGGDSEFDGTYTTPDTAFTRGPHAGGVSLMGFYGFDVGNGGAVNRAFGIQPTGDNWDPGTVTLRVQNNSGQEITEFTLSYLIYVRNNGTQSHSFNFSHSADNATYFPVGELDFASPQAGTSSNPWVSTSRNTIFTGLSIPDSGYYYLRWNSETLASGFFDEFALDDIALSNFTTAAAPVPEPGSIALSSLALIGLTLAGLARRRKYANIPNEYRWRRRVSTDRCRR